MNRKKATAVMSIVIGIVIIIGCIIQIVSANSVIDTKAVGDVAMKAAESMASIESVGGNTVAESYYNEHGTYLMAEAKTWNSITQLNIQQTNILGLMGIGIGSVLAVIGLYAFLEPTRKLAVLKVKKSDD